MGEMSRQYAVGQRSGDGWGNGSLPVSMRDEILAMDSISMAGAAGQSFENCRQRQRGVLWKRRNDVGGLVLCLGLA